MKSTDRQLCKTELYARTDEQSSAPMAQIPAIRHLYLLILVSLVTLAASANAENELLTIHEIQFSDAGQGWASPHAGEIVDCVGGVVTAKFSQRIVLQDLSAGDEWSAIEIRGYPVYPTGIEVGDDVSLQSVYVDEVAGCTTLQYYSASSHTINSSGNPLPEPVSLSVHDIRYPPVPAETEKYAAALVSIDEIVRIGAMDFGGHDDNYELLSYFGDVAYASDYANGDIQVTYYVQSGERYQRIVGILQRYNNDAEWDYYQLLPRSNDDYELCSAGVEIDPVQAELFSITPAQPNPFTIDTRFQLSLSQPAQVKVTIVDITGRSIISLADGLRASGDLNLTWQGQDANGRTQPQGIYIIHADVAGQSITRQIVMTK